MPKRGENIYLRKDKRWEGRFRNGFKADGTAKYSSVYGKTCREVREKLLQKRLELAANENDCNLTIEKLSQVWISAIKHNVKESTLSAYIVKLNKHIIPCLGRIKFNRLTAENISHFADIKIRQGLSVKYVSDILAVLKAMLKYLHRVCNYVDKSRLILKLKCDVQKKEICFDETMQDKLRKHLIENANCSNAGILAAMTTGIRIGELCGLKWGDIDFKKRILTVRRTVQRISCTDSVSTRVIVTEPKSKSSVRVIHLSGLLLTLLEKSRQRDTAVKLGVAENNFCDLRVSSVDEWLAKKTNKNGADVFFECVGKNETINQVINETAAGGKVMLVGNPYGNVEFDKNTYWKILRNQLTVTGSWNSSFTEDESDDWHYVLGKLAEGRIHPEQIISHRFDIAELDKGLHIMRDKSEGFLKVMGRCR